MTTLSEHFEVIAKEKGGSIPLIVHVPHSSTTIPPHIRQTLLLNDEELQQELLCMTDWYTDRLFNGVVGLGGTLFVNRLSRLVVDPERFPDDSQEVMAAKGMGAVYIRTADGASLRRALAQGERSRLLDTYFHPYAQAFSDTVAEILNRHGRCLILDGHSFPSAPLPYELDQRRERPHICLGTDEFHAPDPLSMGMEEIFSEEGLTVAKNKPFAGTYVPLQFWQTDFRVQSLMIEVRRDLYMDERNGVVTPGVHRMQELLINIMRAAIK